MNDQDHSTLKKLFIGLAAVVAIAALAWFIFFRHTDSKNENKQAKTTASQSSGAPASDQKSAGNQKQNSTSTKPGTVAGAGTEQLAASGPGNTITLFVGATVTATIAHRLYRSRRRPALVGQRVN